MDELFLLHWEILQASKRKLFILQNLVDLISEFGKKLMPISTRIDLVSLPTLK